MARSWIALLALALIAGSPLRSAVAQDEPLTEEEKLVEELAKFLNEKGCEGDSAVDLYMTLVESGVAAKRALDLTKKAVEKDPKWDLVPLVDEIDGKRAAGAKAEEIEKMVEKAIEAHEKKE